MSAATSYVTLRKLRAPVIKTGEAAAALGVSESSASRTLRRLAHEGLVLRVRRGTWALDTERSGDPRTIINDLTRPLPAYVSFQSALATHGVIDQIPRETTVASLGRPKRVRTALGTFAVHRLPPGLFGGFEDRSGVPMASVEKALVDYFYVAAASGHPLRRLPELELSADFSEKEIRTWIARIPSPRLQTLVEAGVDRALRHAEFAAPQRPRRVRKPSDAPDGAFARA